MSARRLRLARIDAGAQLVEMPGLAGAAPAGIEAAAVPEQQVHAAVDELVTRWRTQASIASRTAATTSFRGIVVLTSCVAMRRSFGSTVSTSSRKRRNSS